MTPVSRGQYPVGAGATIAALTDAPHPLLRRLREQEPVSWLPVLGGWLVTRRDLAQQVMRDPRTFTVDDPRFSTARVVGPSMLSLDGTEHRRHRDPFTGAFREHQVEARLASVAEAEAARLVAGLARAGAAELRGSLAGPLAAAVMAQVLGLAGTDPRVILSWYQAIVGAVTALSGTGLSGAETAAGAAAFAQLSASVEASIARAGSSSLLAVASQDTGLSTPEIVSNAAVLMFGGIETTEGMIGNAVWYLLGDQAQLAQVVADRSLVAAAVEESLRLEPAAAVVDRYATAEVTLGTAAIRAGDRVTVSLAAAGRDPAFFPDPDRFDIGRENARQHLGFAVGPHFCIGAHLARLEAQTALSALLDALPGLRLEQGSADRPRGLVFRKPPQLRVRWDLPGQE